MSAHTDMLGVDDFPIACFGEMLLQTDLSVKETFTRSAE